MRLKSKLLKVIKIIGGIFLSIALVGWWIYETAIDFSDNEKFDRELWVSSRIVSDRDEALRGRILPRKHMMDDVVENHLKVGMKRDEVLKLLGEPDSIKKHSLYYFTGYGVLIHYCGIEVYFSSKDVVETIDSGCR